RPRGAQVDQLSLAFRPQPLMFEGEARCRPHLVEHPRVVQQIGAVHQYGDRLTAAVQGRERATGRSVELDGPAVGADVATAVKRVGQLEGGVRKRVGQGRTETTACWSLAELDHDPGNSCPRASL